MNKDDLARIAEALIVIVQTLKNQPRFDRLAFGREIEKRIQEIEAGSLTKTVLESISR